MALWKLPWSTRAALGPEEPSRFDTFAEDDAVPGSSDALAIRHFASLPAVGNHRRPSTFGDIGTVHATEQARPYARLPPEIRHFSQRSVAPMDIVMTEESRERIVEIDDDDLVHERFLQQVPSVGLTPNSDVDDQDVYHDAVAFSVSREGSIETRRTMSEEFEETELESSILSTSAMTSDSDSDSVEAGGVSDDEDNSTAEIKSLLLRDVDEMSVQECDNDADVEMDDTSSDDDDEDDDNDDLFASTFGASSTERVTDLELLDEEPSADEASDQSSTVSSRTVSTAIVTPKQPPLKTKSHFSAAIVVDSSGEEGAPKTAELGSPRKANRSSKAQSASASTVSPGPPAIISRPSASLVYHRKLHDRALVLLSRLPTIYTKDPTAHHRYWFVVFPSLPPPSYKPRDINAYHEKDVIWMRGHLKTTGRTIREKYCLNTMISDVVLLVGGREVLADEWQAQEMDYFSDKVVALVSKLKSQFKKGQPVGRDLMEGLIPAEPAPPANTIAAGPDHTTGITVRYGPKEVIDLTA